MRRFLALLALCATTAFGSNTVQAQTHEQHAHHAQQTTAKHKTAKQSTHRIHARGVQRKYVRAPSGSGHGLTLVSEARRYIGTNPTGWAHDWCAHFLDFVLRRTGHRGGGNLAMGYKHYGRRVAGPRVGAIAVMARRGRAAGGSQGGHVGVVSGIDPNGNPVIISGNTWGDGNGRHRVMEQTFPRGRIIAYVIP